MSSCSIVIKVCIKVVPFLTHSLHLFLSSFSSMLLMRVSSPCPLNSISLFNIFVHHCPLPVIIEHIESTRKTWTMKLLDSRHFFRNIRQFPSLAIGKHAVDLSKYTPK